MGRIKGKAFPDHRLNGVHVLVHRFEEGSSRHGFEKVARAKRGCTSFCLQDEEK